MENRKFIRTEYYGKYSSCRADKCFSSVYAHGLCGKHYQRKKRNGDFNIIKRIDRKHGLSNHDLYNTWKGMMDRCYKENSISYKNYGAKGITVCKHWHLIENFIKDMGDRPSSEYELDRINPYGNYELNNCRWATKTEQAYNRKNIKGISWNRFRNKWSAYYGGKSTGKQITKFFNNKEEALKARKEMEKQYAR